MRLQTVGSIEERICSTAAEKQSFADRSITGKPSAPVTSKARFPELLRYQMPGQRLFLACQLLALLACQTPAVFGPANHLQYTFSGLLFDAFELFLACQFHPFFGTAKYGFWPCQMLFLALPDAGFGLPAGDHFLACQVGSLTERLLQKRGRLTFWRASEARLRAREKPPLRTSQMPRLV